MSLFEEEEELVSRKAAHIKALPSWPKTDWKPPEFPNLSGAHSVAIDTETYDPELQDAGPGWARGPKGHIVGVSLAAVDYAGNRGKWYFPMRHEVEPHLNLDANNVLAYLRHTLSDPHTKKVFANAPYDLGWLKQEGVEVKGELHDVQIAQALIDNNSLVSLEDLARNYFQRGKTTDNLYEWIMAAYKPPKTYARREIYRSPVSLVAPYAEDDAMLPLDLMPVMYPLLEYDGLLKAYRLECDLMPMMMAMRYAGVSVNVEGAHRMKEELSIELEAMHQQVWKEYGFDLVDADGKPSMHSNVLGRFFTHIGMPTPKTKKGAPSVTKEWLEDLAKVGNPVGKMLNDMREHEKMIGTFLQSYIIDKNVGGKLFPQFHQVKGEDNGTKVYRFASSDPNLQNIPSRTKLGKRVRRLFIPDEGHALWRKHDYSQIHYRILAHFAVDKGDGSADALRAAYTNNPDMDYHMNVYMATAPLMDWNTNYDKVPDEDGHLDWNEEINDKRRIIKNVNFSGLYGVGIDTLVRRYLIGMTKQQGKDFLKKYHEAAPYINATTEAIAAQTGLDGYVETLLGRKIRFELWEPMAYRGDDPPMPLPYDQAVKQWGSFIRLAKLYRAVNYKFQGSEPDIMKTGMLNLWNSGVFDFTGLPRVTVHDELGWSQIDKSPQQEEAFAYIKHMQEIAIPLRVPVKVDAHTGLTWGDAK